MAGDGSIVQEIELQLNAATAKLLQQQIQDALAKGTDAGAAKKNLGDVEEGLKKTGEAGLNLTRILEHIGVYFGVYEIVDKLKDLAKAIVNAGIEFESLRAELKVFTGDTASATAALEELEELSKTLPFSVRDLATAYTTLRNVGINPTTEQFRNLAGIAAGLNKPITEVADAISRATTGVTRGLIQMGIRAQVDGDTIKLTFRGVTTQIGNNAASILKYMSDLGASKFGTASAEQVNTLAGAWGQLQKTFDRMFESVGKDGLTKVLTDTVKSVTVWVASITDGSEKAKTFADDVAYTIDVVKLMGLTLLAVGETGLGGIIMLVKGVEGLGDAIKGVSKLITGDFRGAVDEMALANARLLEAQRTGSAIASAWSDVVEFAANADVRNEQRLGTRAGAAGPGGSFGKATAPTTTIPGQGAGDPEKVLDQQKQLLAELIKEADERAKIAGITNAEIDQYHQRLDLVRVQQALLERETSLLVKTLETGTMSDNARAKAVTKLDGLVHQSKALQDEAARLLAMITLRQPLAVTNPNNVPGNGGGQNNGVVAANDTSNNNAGIMGLHGGMTAEQWAEHGGLVDDAHTKVIGEATAAVDRYRVAWEDAFQAIGTGKNVFKELEKAVGQTLAAIAQKEAQKNIAYGIEKLAEGIWPPNPAALAASVKYFAAAAAFEILAGAAGSMGGSGSGGGGGGYASPSHNVGGNNVTDTKTLAPIVHVTVNAFDPNNSAHQNYLGDAISQYAQRASPDIIFGGR